MTLPRPVPPALLAALAAGLFAVPAGCGGPRATSTGPTAAERAAEDPWPKLALALRKDTDPATARRLLAQLGNDLAENPAADQPAGLTPDAEKALAAFAALTPDDVGEIRTPVFASLDAPYLADCYYFRDAARSLETAAAPPARQAEAAFAWVCRQVELRPWLTEVQPGAFAANPPLPPAYVLRRGSGSGLERAFVFLAVLQQFGLDGCLVGSPDAQAGRSASAGKPAHPWPFWAVGARVGADVLLFDPFAGTPVPTADGKGVATLAGLKPGDKPTAVFLAAPLSALAPRMKLLEAKLRDEAPVKLALDPLAAKARFAADAKLPDVKFWNPAGEQFSYTRGLGSFLPSDEGGRDTRPAGQRLYDRYRFDLIPRSVFAVPPAVGSIEVRGRLVEMFAGAFAASLLTPPTPREMIQRGEFFEVTPALVAKRKNFLGAKERLRTDAKLDASLKDWVEAANAAYGRLSKAKLDRATNPAAFADAEFGVDAFWKANVAGTLALVDEAVADPGAAETTYLLALCKHEQAERAQGRVDAAKAAADAATGRAKDAADRAAQTAADKARDAWAEARDWWARYEPFAAAQNDGYPGRADHARRLAARAAALAAK